MASQSRAAARYHGDQAAVPGMLDFAVNVRATAPPSWLVDRLASLAGEALPDVVVLRSLTKTWALAGLRVGYALGPRDVLDRMTARRPHWHGCAPFALFTVPDAELMRKRLDGTGIAARRCDTFVGFDGEFLRAAVRPDWPVLVDAIAESLR